jgi:hypothetical protein
MSLYILILTDSKTSTNAELGGLHVEQNHTAQSFYGKNMAI